MENTVIERVNKVIKWYIFLGIVENNADLANKIGYKPSYFSQILGLKVPISEKFIDKLCSLDDNINKVWIFKGSGTMLKTGELIAISPKNVGSGVQVNASTTGNIANGNQGEAIEVLREQLNAKDAQIKELIDVIKALSGVKKL